MSPEHEFLWNVKELLNRRRLTTGWTQGLVFIEHKIMLHIQGAHISLNIGLIQLIIFFYSMLLNLSNVASTYESLEYGLKQFVN